MQRRRISHVEGLATHDDPELCGHAREDVPEALAEAHAGQVLSREIELKSQGPRLFPAPARDVVAVVQGRNSSAGAFDVRMRGASGN